MRCTADEAYVAEQLALYTINTGEIYYNYTYPLIQSYAKKLAAGKFDRKAALKGVTNRIIPIGARMYKKEFGTHVSPTGRLSAKVKECAAEEVLDWMMDGIRDAAKKYPQKRPSKKKGVRVSSNAQTVASRGGGTPSLTRMFGGHEYELWNGEYGAVPSGWISKEQATSAVAKIRREESWDSVRLVSFGGRYWAYVR